MTGLDRRNWPKTKTFDVVQRDPYNVDIIALQKTTPQELEEIATKLMVDLFAFESAGRASFLRKQSIRRSPLNTYPRQ